MIYQKKIKLVSTKGLVKDMINGKVFLIVENTSLKMEHKIIWYFNQFLVTSNKIEIM